MSAVPVVLTRDEQGLGDKRRDELGATRYNVEATSDTVTQGLPVPTKANDRDQTEQWGEQFVLSWVVGRSQNDAWGCRSLATPPHRTWEVGDLSGLRPLPVAKAPYPGGSWWQRQAPKRICSYCAGHMSYLRLTASLNP